jgi:hypothetical protein
LKIQLEVGKNKKADGFLARIYEEKGHILVSLGEKNMKDESKMIDY